MTGWALITGAARRIGRAVALDLAAHGWDIIVHYNRSGDEARVLAAEIDALGRAVCLAEIDLANPKNAERLIPSLAAEIGMIDALVNNAALFETDASDADGTRHWAVNAEAPRLLSNAFRDHLPPGERGVIVNMLDATPVGENFSAYGKSKQRLADMTRDMAISFAPRVRVNGVAPCYILPSPRQSEAAFRQMAGDAIATPQQVAAAVRRLIETQATTGQIVVIDGKADVSQAEQ